MKARGVALLLATAVLVASPVPSVAQEDPETVLILFDASHSMGRWLYTKPMLEIAKDGVHEALTRIERDTVLGFRAFAHEVTMAPCETTEMLVEFDTGNSAAVAAAVDELDSEGTKTPLAYTLQLAREELEARPGKRRIVLLSDGNDTCEGDPVAEAAQLGEMGIPLDIVGIGAQRQIQQHADMAAANGLGTYAQARNPQQFSDAIGELFQPPNMPPGGAGEENPLMTEIELEDGPAEEAAEETPAQAPPAEEPQEPEVQDEPEEPAAPEEEEESAATTVGADLEIILDASNSMWGQIDGVAKIELARRALGEALDELEAAPVVTAFRAYGHRVSREDREAGCLDTELIHDFVRGELPAIRATADALNPKGQTPIALSLEKAGEDLLARPGYKHYLLLLSDGIESCDGDPVAAAQRLRDAGIDIVIHTVGFDVDEEAEQQLRGIADATLGTYFDAGDYESLAAALREIAAEVVEVAEMTEEHRERNPVIGGPTIEEAVDIAPGRYTLERHLESREYTHFKVALDSGDLFTISTQVTTQVPVDRGEAIHNSHIRAYVFTTEGDEVRGVNAVAIGEPGTRAVGRYLASEPTELVVAIGADFNAVHRDSLFELAVTRRTDAGSGRDLTADDDHPLAPGTVRGSLGLQDRVDRYQLDGPLVEGTVWRFVTTPSIGDTRLQVAVVDGNGRRLARATSRDGANELEVTLPAGVSAVFLELTDRTVSSAGLLWSYTIEVTNE